MQHFGYVAFARPLLSAVYYTKTHEGIKGAFLAFHKDADMIYPVRKEKRGYIGESSVQAATFDSKKKATAAAILVIPLCQSSKDHLQVLGGCRRLYVAAPITIGAMR